MKNNEEEDGKATEGNSFLEKRQRGNARPGEGGREGETRWERGEGCRGGSAKTKYTGEQASEKCTGFNETVNTSDEAAETSVTEERRRRKRDGEKARIAWCVRMARPYFNRGRKGEGETGKGKGREERAESRIPVKASVRQDIVLAGDSRNARRGEPRDRRRGRRNTE